jgi:hypothetical protein
MEPVMRTPLLRFVRDGGHINYSLFDDELKGIVREVGVRNMYLQNRLYELIGSFDRKGISATVLKGSHLIHTIYPFGIRPIEDIDLLIKRDDFQMADQILRSMGYEDCAVGMDLWTHLTFSNKITYINTTHPIIPIDIHFSLGPYPYLGRISREVLLDHTESLETPKGRLTVLGPEGLLIHLCLHLFQHHFDDWQVSCCDIIAVIRHYDDKMDWDKFKALVNSSKIILPVNYSLQKASLLAEIKVPASNDFGKKQPNIFDRYIFSTSKKQKSQSDRYFLQFLTTPGFLLKLQCAVKIFAPGKSFLRYYYNGSYGKYAVYMIKTAVKFTSAVFIRR